MGRSGEINENKTRGNERLIYVDRELIRIRKGPLTD